MSKGITIEKLKSIIEEEDIRNPYTDVEISKLINVNRSEITSTRISLKIKDSRGRRRKLLVNDVQLILEKDKSASIRKITNRLNEIGYKISRNSLFNLLKEIKTPTEDLLVMNEKKNNNNNNTNLIKDEVSFDAFDSLIGSKGSLKQKIELAKAAILYPENGIHTMVYGPTGVGKSQLVECMYKFAVETKTKKADAPFIVFNCADYADNPQLLLSQLFGYKKGAFTGANEDKVGLVEKADNGILFLDEIHRLPAEGQEMFFHLIDRGEFRRLGESEKYRKVNVLLVAATTENLNSSLLKTFKRRIPMAIELPSLHDRPLEERYLIVENFFKQEASRMNAKLVVSQNVVIAFLLYEAIGNIGQIRSDVQVTCARSFLKRIEKKDEAIEIKITEVPEMVLKGLLNINSHREELNELVKKDLVINNSKDIPINIQNDESYIFLNDSYKNIEEKYKMMKFQGIEEEIINRIIENEFENKIYKSMRAIKSNENKMGKQNLEEIVGSKIVLTVELMIQVAEEHYKEIDSNLLYLLATHIATAYERIVQRKHIKNPRLGIIKTKYPNEFLVAKEMSELAGYKLNIDFPDEEIAFIAMYLKSSIDRNKYFQKNVGIVVLSHGNVAKGMVDVVNKLLGINHAKAVEMSLDEPSSVAFKKAMEVAKASANGKGVLFLIDMGSLAGMCEIIGKELFIKTRIISRVDTLMVIEAVRKAMMPESDLDEIADFLELNNKFALTKNSVNDSKKIIICACLTGEGTAKALARLIKEKLKPINKIEIQTMSVLEEYNILENVKKTFKTKQIIAIVSTIDPRIPFIPFIYANDIIDGTGIDRLEKYIYLNNNILSKPIVENNILVEKLINENTTLIKSKITTKEEAIEKMTNLLFDQGYVTKDFKESLKKREEMLSTYLMGDIALPHGDTQHVIEPVIGILTLENPIKWDNDNYVDCILVIAINKYLKEEFRKLYKIINNEYFLNKIKKSKSYFELKEVIKNV